MSLFPLTKYFLVGLILIDELKYLLKCFGLICWVWKVFAKIPHCVSPWKPEKHLNCLIFHIFRFHFLSKNAIRIESQVVMELHWFLDSNRYLSTNVSDPFELMCCLQVSLHITLSFQYLSTFMVFALLELFINKWYFVVNVEA